MSEVSMDSLWKYVGNPSSETSGSIVCSSWQVICVSAESGSTSLHDCHSRYATTGIL